MAICKWHTRLVMYIWGASYIGRDALFYFGGDNVEAFIDNSYDKQGKLFCGKKVISFSDYLREDGDDKHIVICALWENALDIQKQLKESGIDDYAVFDLQLFECVDLLLNQYEQFEGVSEDAWNERITSDGSIQSVSEYVERIQNKGALFHEIEIETINHCNGTCSFCPVNSIIDPRPLKKMEMELFKKIISELHEMDYAGRIALFSNNEPFLDDRMPDMLRMVKEMLPKAHAHLFTNGTLLSVELFKKIIPSLDELIIDNYDQRLQLIPPVKMIKEYIEGINDPVIRKKTKILLRKPKEILSSRGGDAPNRESIIDVSQTSCGLPFCQMIVRPDGKVSLCCNDPLGKMTLGDLNDESLMDVWYGEKYIEIRNRIAKGRKNIKHCERCDTFMTI